MTFQAENAHGWLQRAHEALTSAEASLEEGATFSVVNRCYYACFYCVLATLELEDMSSNKHTGVRSLFNKHLVKPGLVSKSVGEVYNRLFEARQDTDYVASAMVTTEEAQSYFAEARQFVEEIETYVNKRIAKN